MESIYGEYKDNLEKVKDYILYKIEDYNKPYEKTDHKLYEHLSVRIKSEESMKEKCIRKNLPVTPHSALSELTDSIGFRIVCSFVEDIYKNIELIKNFENCSVVKEKDYIKNAKPNGYRSYHLILAVQTPFEDVNHNVPGTYYVEIQLRTIAMDTWAALEHQLKYKRNIKNTKIIEYELKRVADELASCDLSMQTIRHLINDEEEHNENTTS